MVLILRFTLTLTLALYHDGRGDTHLSIRLSYSNGNGTRFVEEVIRIVDGRIHVTAGVSDPDVRRSQRLARHAVEEGADGVLCQAPMDIIEDKEQVKAFMHELANFDLLMLMIQDLHWNGYGMGLDTIRELWEEIDSFRCASSWRPCTQGTR